MNNAPDHVVEWLKWMGGWTDGDSAGSDAEARERLQKCAGQLSGQRLQALSRAAVGLVCDGRERGERRES